MTPPIQAAPGALAPTATAMRSALGLFATGVTIVTTRSASGEAVGLTANSFNSVSLHPPLVLWSLALKAGSLQAFMQAQHFAIHVLSVEQQKLAERFSSRVQDRFRNTATRDGLGGTPILPDCAAVFECRSRSQYPEGDHVIFVGEVLACQHDASRSPLLFHGGKFYTEHPL